MTEQPVYLKEILKDYGMENILFLAVADIAEDDTYADTWVALTDDRVLIAACKKQRGESRMGGYDSNFRERRAQKVERRDVAVRVLENDKTEALKVEREISGGILYAVTGRGDERVLRFSGTKLDDFMRLCTVYEKVKKGEEVTEEDRRGKERPCCPKCGTLYPDPERKICPRCMDKRSLTFRLMGYMTKYRGMLAVMLVCYALTALLNLIWPYLNGTILYDRVLAEDDAWLSGFGIPGGEYVLALGLLVVIMFLTKLTIQGVGALQAVMMARMAPDIMARLKRQVFDAMGKLPISFFSSRQTGGLITRVADDADELTDFFIEGIPYFITNVGTILATIVVMFLLNPVLAVASVCLLPVLLGLSLFMLPKLWHIFGKRHRARRSMNGQINENFKGSRVVKAFGREEQETERFRGRNARVREAEVQAAAYDNKFFILYDGVENAMNFLVWVVGAFLILGRSGLELGELITFTGYVSQLKGPLEFLSRFFRWYTDAMNSAERMFEIIDAVPELREKEHPVVLDEVRGEIELRNVTFGYEPHKPVLKQVSFHVNPGEMIGIVGRSGAGKTTLVNLISRLYDVEEGAVYFDGVDVRDLSFRQLRTSIAMVSQETYIFMGTVAENIAYARPDASREEIVSAAIRASAHDFICKMPEGYDTVLGASGRELSGGEKQRISIARAILANPKVLILDEATSAVDTQTELDIQKSLDQLVKNRTTISIAHRLSTLRSADYLVVIDDGRVAEAGTHEELIAKKGVFYRLMELQTKALAMRGLQ
ncbi:MAG: ABC transporter ATP-binding protein [Lachnospiraceae bacterium]|nr:ABC transporter ATP-binding protein [Lachnospiraceae bacterium]